MEKHKIFIDLIIFLFFPYLVFANDIIIDNNVSKSNQPQITLATKQTILSLITGNSVNINTNNNTHLKGSLIAAGFYDKDGNFIDNSNNSFGSAANGNTFRSVVKSLGYTYNNPHTKPGDAVAWTIGGNIGEKSSYLYNIITLPTIIITGSLLFTKYSPHS